MSQGHELKPKLDSRTLSFDISSITNKTWMSYHSSHLTIYISRSLSLAFALLEY